MSRRAGIRSSFAADALARRTDDALQTFDQALADLDRAARRARDEHQRRAGRTADDAVRRFVQLGRLLLEARERGRAPLRLIEQQIGLERLRGELDAAERLTRPDTDPYLEQLADRAAAIDRLLAPVLQTLEFHAGPSDRALLDVLGLLRGLDGTGRRWLPGPVPAFVPKAWRGWMFDADRGRVDRRALAVAGAFELRAGRVWLEHSHRHTDPATHLLPDDRWHALRGDFMQAVGQPERASDRLAQLGAEQSERLRMLDDALEAEAGVRLEAGRPVLTPPPGEGEPASLAQALADRLPHLDLGELLLEIDGWTGFSDCFAHAGGAASRAPELTRTLYAVLVAQATNLGLTRMAEISDLSYDQLAWASEWYLREDTLRAAIVRLVDFHHALPLAQAWGSGQLSSSDGQRFPTRSRAPGSTPLPRWFGHRRWACSCSPGPQTNTASTAPRSSPPASATPPTCSTRSSTTRPPSKSKSTPPTRTATPNSSSASLTCSASDSRRACAAYTTNGSTSTGHRRPPAALPPNCCDTACGAS